MAALVDFVLHFDKHLAFVFQAYGTLTYVFLVAVIFAETGLVLTPFLPGDSLLFSVGAFAAQGALDITILFVTLTVAAILGDTVNYWLGYHIGLRVFTGNRFFKKEYLERTEQFYARHGKKTIILARFMPIIRTFAPFVAGIGKMQYRTFLIYNVTGGVVWIGLFIFAGYFFGELPVVQENFSLFILGIIGLSIVPALWGVIRSYFTKNDILK
ncbi:MAG: DedA family protein [Candidatus Yanofskybacteria bacterium]|nr:DedA family protein [Candidatus Yanofskybacteria bacterium]